MGPDPAGGGWEGFSFYSFQEKREKKPPCMGDTPGPAWRQTWGQACPKTPSPRHTRLNLDPPDSTLPQNHKPHSDRGDNGTSPRFPRCGDAQESRDTFDHRLFREVLNPPLTPIVLRPLYPA
jgi:hypothetical protein